ncbi:MAG: DUF819 domain-containing protein [Rubrobacteraceae bacterium]
MFEGVLIASPFGVGAVVTALIAFTFWLDRRFRVFSFFGTAILVITGAAILVNLGVIPPSIPVGDQEEINPVYTFATDYAVPLAIVLLLATADLRSIRRAGKPAIIAFLIGVAVTAVGAVVATLIMAGPIGPEAWKLGGQFAGSYAGGGLNYVAVGEAVGTSDTMFATGAAADTVMTNIWIVMTAFIPVVLLRFYASIKDWDDEAGDEEDTGAGTGDAFWEEKGISIYDVVYLAALTFIVVAVAEFIAPYINQLLGFEVPTVIWYTTIALALAFTPLSQLSGGEEFGNFFLHLFFVVLGAGTVLSTLVDKGLVVFLFLVILISFHGVIIFGIGWLAKLEIETLSVASQACIGGPSTALALAISKRWRALITPAVLIGVLGYAVGNYLGIGLAYLLRSWTG